MATNEVTPGGDAAGERPTMFLRKASGVVKAFSPFDSFAYNSIANNPFTLGAIAFLLIVYAMPGGNIALGTIITAVFTAFCCVTYSLLQSAMPRTGGDYVFQSRILGGAPGFLMSFATYVTTDAVWLGLNGWMVGNMVLGPILVLLGTYWNNQPMKDVAAFLVTPAGIFVGGFIMLAWITFICSVGFAIYAKVQRYFFWVGVATMFGVLIFLLFFTQEGFTSSFNAFMSQRYGVAGAYQSIIDTAKTAGYSANYSFNLSATFAMVPSLWFVLMSTMWGAGNAGEIRDKGTFRTKLSQILGALAFSAAITAVLAYEITSRFGSEFLASASYLYYNAPDKYILPVAPMFSFFAAALSSNFILVAVIFLGSFCWWFMACPNALIYASRAILAMSMDRTVPAWFGKVNGRTHGPLNAVLSVAALGVVFLALYAFTDWFWKLTLSLGLLIILSYGLTCVSAALWPYIKREAFQASPISRYKVGGIPLITICGAIFVIGAIWVIWQFITVPALGVRDPVGISFVLGDLALGTILYFVFKIYRRRKESLDLALVYKEIPPE
jgi:basic amino acid/polyamine antiporter, APA family